MGITLVPFTDATTMVSADMRTSLEDIRNFQNTGMVTDDLTGTLRKRNFKHTESYGAPSPRTVGSAGGIWNRRSGGEPLDEAIFTFDAAGPAFENVWAAHGTMVFPEDGRIEITACVWAWHLKAASTANAVAEVGSYTSRWGEAVSVRLAVDADGLGYTGRRVWNAGCSVNTVLRYPARQIGMAGSVAVSAGRRQIGVQVYMEDMTDYTGDSGYLYVRARVMSCEFFRR